MLSHVLVAEPGYAMFRRFGHVCRALRSLGPVGVASLVAVEMGQLTRLGLTAASHQLGALAAALIPSPSMGTREAASGTFSTVF